MNINNRTLKGFSIVLGKLGLKLTKHEIFEILSDGTSKSQIDGWLRNENATKSATGTQRGRTVLRYREMPTEKLELFLDNLPDWVDEKLWGEDNPADAGKHD